MASTTYTYMPFGDGARVDNGFLDGRVRERWSRPSQGALKTATLGREVDGWYDCIVCPEESAERIPLANQESGMDVRLQAFLATVQGSQIANHRWRPTMERTLQWHQRRVPRRKKAAKLLPNTYQAVRRQSWDMYVKTANPLLAQFDTITHERVQVRTMIRNHHLAKAIRDALGARCRATLNSKAACAGRTVRAVTAQYTSQAYSCRGARISTSLGPGHLAVQPVGIGRRTPRCRSHGPGRPFGEACR
jgi:putative transposase